MFDLPVETATDRRNYRRFVKHLKKSGFVMFQESIYIRLSINAATAKAIAKSLKNHLPPKGLVSMMTVTEKQFSSMDFLLGSFVTDVITSDDRVIEL